MQLTAHGILPDKLLLHTSDMFLVLKHKLRQHEHVLSVLLSNMDLVVTELLAEASASASTSELEFPSEEILDVLQAYDGSVRRDLQKALQGFARDLMQRLDQYRLLDPGMLHYFRLCRMVGEDMVLSPIPLSRYQERRGFHELPL